MGHQVIQQPDGKFAVFSTGTSSWILYDASQEELGDYYAEKAASEARASAVRTAELVRAGRARQVYFQFTMSFAEANAQSAMSGGEVLPGLLDGRVFVEAGD